MAGKSRLHLSPDTRDIPSELARHRSHGLGDHAVGHHKPGNIALDGSPKKIFSVGIKDGMQRHVDGDHPQMLRVGGGGMKSALESGSVGPSIGDLLKAPPKNFASAPAAFGQRSRNAESIEQPGGGPPGYHARTKAGIGAGPADHAIGERILREAAGNFPNGLPKKVNY